MQKRPNKTDDIVIDKVAYKLLPHIVDWLKQNGDDIEDNESIFKDIQKALKWGPKDGYDLAKDFDSMGWCPDSELVDILNDVSSYTYSVHQVLCTQWVADNNIIAPPLNSKVKCKNHPKVKDAIGILTNIYPDGTATITLDGKPSGGYILPWEEFEIINEH